MRFFFVWLASGALAGWLSGLVFREGTRAGAVSRLTLGCAGALVGGWLCRRLHIVTPDSLAGHVVVALIGAAALLVALRATYQVWGFVPKPSWVAQEPGADLDTQIRRLSDLERRVLSSVLGRRRVSRDPNVVFDSQLTFGERVADRVATFGGSWTFLGLFAAVLIGWLILNDEMARPFDPFPFILLNLVLSCLAAVQAPVIMMSQNRQAAKDRIDARTDYETNVRAEMEIMGLHAKLDTMRDREWAELMRLQTEQLQRLQAVVDGLAADRLGKPRQGEP